MKAENRDSAHYSDATSHEQPTKLSEADYLAQQARDARQALSCALQDTQTALKSTADVRLWTRQYPLALTASALLAGFLASSTLVPRTRAAQRGQRARAASRARARGGERWSAPLIRQMKRLIRANLQRVISGFIAGAVVHRARAAATYDGHPEPDSAPQAPDIS
jgi:hypothetical protein